MKLDSASGSPLPLYFAYCGYLQSGRCMAFLPGAAKLLVATIFLLEGFTPFSIHFLHSFERWSRALERTNTCAPSFHGRGHLGWLCDALGRASGTCERPPAVQAYGHRLKLRPQESSF